MWNEHFTVDRDSTRSRRVAVPLKISEEFIKLLRKIGGSRNIKETPRLPAV